MEQRNSVPILSLHNVSKNFGGVRAVSNITLDVLSGERKLIIGTNGAGKTTLFNMIAGDLSVSEGSIELFGENVTQMSVRKRVKKGIRRTYQTSSLFDGLTVRQNFYLALLGDEKTLSHLNMFKQYRKNKSYEVEIEKLSREVGIYDKLEEQVANLSHGERRQLEFGLAIITKPKMLLFDEPAAGLSAEEREIMKGLIQKLDRSVTVIMIEHDIELAFAVADNVVVMFDGEVVAEGSVEEIRNNDIVKRIYLGEALHE